MKEKKKTEKAKRKIKLKNGIKKKPLKSYDNIIHIGKACLSKVKQPKA